MNEDYLLRNGVHVRRLLNELKRDVSVAAKELEVDESQLNKIIMGHIPPPHDLIKKAVQLWPINERDLHVVRNDAPLGIKVTTAEESHASRRVFSRGGTDYYEYRDTAMSRLAAIRPEWLELLQVVDDTSPDNPLIRWNRGHFPYQITYFINESNFYWQNNGKNFCERMQPGDSVLTMPYVPHSFTSCKGMALGKILALTFLGPLSGDAQLELDALGPIQTWVSEFQTTISNSPGALLHRALNDSSHTAESISTLTGIPIHRLNSALSNKKHLAQSDIRLISNLLSIPESNLTQQSFAEPPPVYIRRAADAQLWDYPNEDDCAYIFRELAMHSAVSWSRSFEVGLGQSKKIQFLSTSMHQYCYNLGPESITLIWNYQGQKHTKLLGPDDSVYIRPFVRHAFVCHTSKETTRLIVLRVKGKLSKDAEQSARLLGIDRLHRLMTENKQWFSI